VIRSDGRLALHGRVSEVINVLGKKLAAGPIEQAVQDKFGVGGVCVFAASDPNLADMLHVVIESSQPIAAADLGVTLRGAIAGAGTLFFRTHYIEPLPRNDMGKIQRNLLKHRLGIP
jgi:acyl-coenzyme A synthetase/AMP-(fatty) acid ligase